MEAITREEKIMSGENLTPITRKEMFLAKAAGQNIETPEPITREEMFLSKISGGGGGGALVVTVLTRIDPDAGGFVKTADKTKSEIKEAVMKGMTVTLKDCVESGEGAEPFLLAIFWDVSLDYYGNVVIHGLDGVGSELANGCYRRGYKYTDDGLETLDETWFAMNRLYISHRFHITSNNGTLWSVEVDDDGNLQVDKVSVPK